MRDGILQLAKLLLLALLIGPKPSDCSQRTFSAVRVSHCVLAWSTARERT